MRRAVVVSLAVAASVGCVLSALAQGAQQQLGVSAEVQSACSLDGFANPAALHMQIPVSGAGIIDTTPQTFIVPNVICSTAIDLVTTSINDGVRTPTPAPSGFTNVIDYKGTATYGKAKAFINTSSKSGGKADSTKGPTNAPLVIEVAPKLPALPLAQGTTYQDTLRVTLTPK